MDPLRKPDEPPGLPAWLVAATLAVCVLPALLNLGGVDLASPAPAGGAAAVSHELALRSLSGAFQHLLLEWTAVCTALFIAVLAFVNYAIKRDPVAPVIGLGLLCAGCTDAFHALASTRLLDGSAPTADLEPFTWALARSLHVAILIVGVGALLLARGRSPWRSGRLVLGAAIAFGALSLCAIWLCANSARLPPTTFPERVISRPWDALPLLLFLGAGLLLYPRLVRCRPSLFTQALVLGAAPEVVTEIYMTFGSTALFDNDFNVAHGLKLVAYLVPLSGLVLESVRSYREEAALVERLRGAQDLLGQQNEQLEQYAYAVAHDLRSPLRAIGSLSTFVQEDLTAGDYQAVRTHVSTIRERAKRMDDLIQGILDYSAAVGTPRAPETVEVAALCAEIVDDMEVPSGFEVELPAPCALRTERIALRQVLANLVDNAVKHHDKSVGRVAVSVRAGGTHFEFAVSDDGPGIPPQYQRRVFGLFQTLARRDEVEGSGVGLALVEKLVARNGGAVRIESDGRTGTTVAFTWRSHEPLKAELGRHDTGRRRARRRRRGEAVA